MIARTYKRKADADHYLDLIQTFPLRPIRSEREHDAAIAVLDKTAASRFRQCFWLGRGRLGLLDSRVFIRQME